MVVLFSFQSISNWLFFRDNLKQAITRPRLHCQLFPPTVVYEPTFPAALIPKLQQYSHAYVTNSTYDVSGMDYAPLLYFVPLIHQNQQIIVYSQRVQSLVIISGSCFEESGIMFSNEQSLSSKPISEVSFERNLHG